MNSKNSVQSYRDEFANLALLTDFYQLSMAYAYFKKGLHNRRSVFHLFFRKPTFKGGFTVAAGLEAVCHFIEQFHFSKDDINYLRTILNPVGSPYFDEPFLEMLGSLKLSVSIDAVPEGSVVFPYEPLLRIEGPLMQCQLLESTLLNLINFPTLIATKAARMALAAQNDSVLEFGLRRAQGIDGALTASRAAYIGGTNSTSNVLAGKLFGIPVSGTQAHSWIMAFADEEKAFQAYADVLPDSALLLVDTYDTLEGVKKAIHIGNELRKMGKSLLGIRLDSGDLAYLSIESRKMLDEAGFPDALIVASNELDEVLISELKRQGAKITVWGVGTNLVTGKEQPALDGVYKLSMIEDDTGTLQYTLKLSEQLAKVSNPGIQQVRRFYKAGNAFADVIYDTHQQVLHPMQATDPFDPTRLITLDETLTYKDLLVPIFREGMRVYELPALHDIRQHTKEELQKFTSGMKRFINPHTYPVNMEKRFYDLRVALIQKVRKG